jgi:F-type H+-transporting ATPase subunit b
LDQLLRDLHIEPRLIPVMGAGFLVLYWLLSRFLFQPIHGMLERRREHINERLDQVEREKDEMVRIRGEYEQRLADVEQEARARIQVAIKEAQATKDEIIAEARARADSVLQSAQYEIDQQKEKAKIELSDYVVRLSTMLAGKLIGEEMNEERHRRLVREFIDSVRPAQ